MRPSQNDRILHKAAFGILPLKKSNRRITPSEESRLWDFIFEKHQGSYLRSTLVQTLLRNRALEYARDGNKRNPMAFALADLLDSLPESNPRVTRKPPGREAL